MVPEGTRKEVLHRRAGRDSKTSATLTARAAMGTTAQGTLTEMYAWLVPRIVFPLYERLSGARFWTEVLRLRDLQWRTPEELEARALQKLRTLLMHAVGHVPYYRDLCKRARIQPEDLRTLADLSYVPITTKADLRNNFPGRTTADNLPEGRRWRTVTSGSTGFPFEFYTDRAGLDNFRASYLFFLEWAGAFPWDTLIHIASPPSQAYHSNFPKSPMVTQSMRRLLLGERIIHLPGMELTPALFQARIHCLSRRRPYFILGTPSYIGQVAARLLEDATGLPAYPKVVITGNETLTPANAATIQAAFRCAVVNQYSAWEVPQMAQTCPDNPGVLHVNSERVVLRVVREDGSAAAPGERGRVVLTSLSNYVMPFINYELGDWTVAGKTCPCGRGLPTLLSLDGRTGEMIRTPAGKTIAPASLTNFLTFACQIIPYVWEYQAVQIAPDTIALRVVPTSRFTAETARRLKSDLEGFLGPGVTVVIERHDHIPREPSGKRLIIKSDLPPS